MVPQIHFSVRRLSLIDCDVVQDCYDSQPRIMLAAKNRNAPAYARTFNQLLGTGCIAYGTFVAGRLSAFVILWPWPDLPASTLVLFCSRPDGKIFNPERTGLRHAMDAALAHAEQSGRNTLYFIRARSSKWLNSKILNRFGRFSEYRASPIQTLPPGGVSGFSGINSRVLNNMPASAAGVVIVAVSPSATDF
jgi:hypothetical protein